MAYLKHMIFHFSLAKLHRHQQVLHSKKIKVMAIANDFFQILEPNYNTFQYYTK